MCSAAAAGIQLITAGQGKLRYRLACNIMVPIALSYEPLEEGIHPLGSVSDAGWLPAGSAVSEELSWNGRC